MFCQATVSAPPGVEPTGLAVRLGPGAVTVTGLLTPRRCQLLFAKKRTS